MQFPTCRHGETTDSPVLRQCRSPRLTGQLLVTALHCNRCYCRDHEWAENDAGTAARLLRCACLGSRVTDRRETTSHTEDDERFACLDPRHRQTTLTQCQACPDYLFPLVTPETPISQVQRLLALPPRPQRSEWWQWENVQAAHRAMVAEAIANIPPVPRGLTGRGIVIVGGGKYFVSAYVVIRVLRELGCTLPVELWHLADEIEPWMRALVSPLNVACRDAEHLAQRAPYRFLKGHWWRGWQLKAFALRHCAFREVLMLDADSYPVRHPEFLFRWPGYLERGAVFWPDLSMNLGMIPQNAWQIFGVDEFAELPTESGQLLVNRELCWREINLALHYNAHADFVYQILYGDKDTFPLAWYRLGRRYARMWPQAEFDSVAIRQLDDSGKLLFLHRVHDKFRIARARFDGTPQQYEGNRFHGQFPLESFCFDVLDELTRSDLPPRDSRFCHA